MLNNLWKETELLRKEQDNLHDYYLEIIADINIYYGEILTDSTVSNWSDSLEIAKIVANAEPIDRDGLEPANCVSERDFIDAVIALTKKNIELLKAECIDNSFQVRHIFVVTKALFVTAATSIISIAPLTLFLGALTYLYLAKKEVNFQKENLGSMIITEQIIQDNNMKIEQFYKFQKSL